jgi:sporulation protein YhbH
MAIFRDYQSGGRDRSAEDKRRHRQLVEESIKKNIGNIIAEESIIGQSKGKKIKIPIKSIKEYQFIYGKNKPGVGSGDGSEKKGDLVGEEQMEDGKGNQGPGNEEGEDIYETEVTIEELIKYLYDDLQLPDIDKKKLSEVESDQARRQLGYQRKGIPQRLAKKRSIIEKIKRKQGYKRNHSEDPESEEKHFPFSEDDLRYKRIKVTTKKEFNAVVICIMDVSGSMDQTKKFIARTFYFLLYQFTRLKYSNVEVVFVAHTTKGKEVSEQDFFHRGESGGTYISSGYNKALEIIEERYNPVAWNIYAFHCSDGDNWSEDNQRAVKAAQKLCEVSNLFGYGEIQTGYYIPETTIRDDFKKSINSKNFAIITLTKKEDILPGLKRLLEKEGDTE